MIWPIHKLFYTENEKQLRAKIAGLEMTGAKLVSVTHERLDGDDQAFVMKRALYSTIRVCLFIGSLAVFGWGYCVVTVHHT